MTSPQEKRDASSERASWLENHRIHFETLGASSAVVAIAISVVALVQSCNANSLQNRQIRLVEAEQQPQIALIPEGDNRDDRIAVDAVGTYTDAVVSGVAYLRVAIQGKPRPAFLLISGYFSGAENTKTVGNPIAVLQGPDQIANLIKLESSPQNDKITQQVDVELIRYVRIQYRDVYEQSRTRYLSLSPPGVPLRTSVVPDTEGKERFARYDKLGVQTTDAGDVIKDLGAVTPTTIYMKAKKLVG